MERYQLRIREDQSLEGILNESMDAVWNVISRHPAMPILQPREKEELKSKLGKIFSRFIVRYDVCGLQAICEEAIEPAEWNRIPKHELWPRHPWQAQEIKRLVLVVEKRLEEFVDALEAEIFKDILATPERAHLAKALRPDLGQAIRESIGPYLYKSVACGMSELCREAVPIDPWK